MLGTELDKFSESLIAGRYNLLLGSGASLGSTNSRDELLLTSEELRQSLCGLRDVKQSTSLARIYGMLTDAEVESEITSRFSGCKPSSSLLPFVKYLWNRIFTFNVDDVIQNLYKHNNDSKQSLVTKNYIDQYEPDKDRDELLIVHLHGWTGRPQDKYVFSHNDYARVMRETNPWMVMLGQILATEPFIIAGTSLEEVDLEFYLSKRTVGTPRKERGPSLLIEPFPDDATKHACEKYGLLLIEGTFQDFLVWLKKEIPTALTAAELLVPDDSQIFATSSDSRTKIKFYSDFRLVRPSLNDEPLRLSSFFNGHPPTESDFHCHADIQREDTSLLLNDIRLRLKAERDADMIVYYGDPGSGKTTIAGRVAHDLARLGIPVFEVTSLSKINREAAKECLGNLKTRAVLIIDGLADHIEQIVDLLSEDYRMRQNLVILGTERVYRKEHIDRVLAGTPTLIRQASPTSARERLELITRYAQLGLSGLPEAIKQPDTFAKKLERDPIAVAICRLLNDFQPLDRIVESLWLECHAELKVPYLAAVVARHCYSGGIRYSLLQDIAGPNSAVSDLFVKEFTPLLLIDNPDNEDYAIPANNAVAERLLDRAKKKDRDILLQVFQSLASTLAPFVNRNAIRMRTPEARLTQRLFDSDTIATPLLGDAAIGWYEQCQQEWGWNSRYWEQRALLALPSDLDLALRYARHAVGIEEHSYTLTTLAKVLVHQLECAESEPEIILKDIISSIDRAIRRESERARVSVHPFMVLLRAAIFTKSKRLGISSQLQTKIDDLVASADRAYSRDPSVATLLRQLREA